MRKTATAAVLFGCLLIGACGAGGGGEPLAAPAPPPQVVRAETPELERIDLDEEPRDLTAWEKIRARVEPDGTVPKDVALQAFALAFGPIPGVDVPSGEPGIDSGTTALRWISRYIDELTPQQRIAIETALDPAQLSVQLIAFEQGIFDTEFSCTVSNEGIAEDGANSETLRPLVDEELATVEAAFGFKLGIPVYLTVGLAAGSKHADRNVHAWTSPQSPDCATKPATSCRVHLYVDKLKKYDNRRARSVVAHELIHCFQATWTAARDALRRPDWITEGFPDFAGDELHPGAQETNLWTYIARPSTPLFERDYDAQGFFFHLYRSGGDVYDRYRAAFRLANNMDAFMHLVGTTGKAFTDTWASALTMEPDRGAAWDMPDAPNDAETGFVKKVLINGNFVALHADPAQTKLGHITFTSEIVRFKAKGEGNGRVNWDGGGDVTLSSLAGKEYCNRPDGCVCPPGTNGSPPSAKLPSDSAQVSAAGTRGGTYFDIEGVSLDDYCKGDPCIVGEWENDEWLLPGPVASLSAQGGAGARMKIDSSGRAEWDFDPMEPLVMHDPDIDFTTTMDTSGTATGRVTASGGIWTVDETDLSNVRGVMALSIGGNVASEGHGAFIGLLDGTFTCKDDALNYWTTHPVEGSRIGIVFHRK